MQNYKNKLQWLFPCFCTRIFSRPNALVCLQFCVLKVVNSHGQIEVQVVVMLFSLIVYFLWSRMAVYAVLWLVHCWINDCMNDQSKTWSCWCSLSLAVLCWTQWLRGYWFNSRSFHYQVTLSKLFTRHIPICEPCQLSNQKQTNKNANKTKSCIRGLWDQLNWGFWPLFITHNSNYCCSASSILSICMPVGLSHGWISPKRCKLGSPNLHRRLPGRL